jgi:hypothetical protein
MSHVARVEMEVQDLAALKAAVKAAGLEWKEGQKKFKWYGSWQNDYNASNAAYRQGIKTEDYGKCEHAIGVPGSKEAYEIGVCKNPKGTGHVLVWDFWQGGYGLQALAGDGCSNVVKGYVAEVAKKKMVAQGYTCTQTKLPTGEVKLQFVKY